MIKSNVERRNLKRGRGIGALYHGPAPSQRGLAARGGLLGPGAWPDDRCSSDDLARAAARNWDRLPQECERRAIAGRLRARQELAVRESEEAEAAVTTPVADDENAEVYQLPVCGIKGVHWPVVDTWVVG